MGRGKSGSGGLSLGLVAGLFVLGVSIDSYGGPPDDYSHLNAFYKKLNEIAKKDKDHPERVKADITASIKREDADAISNEEEAFSKELDDKEDELVADSKVHNDDEMSKEENAFFEKRGHDIGEWNTLCQNSDYEKVCKQIEEEVFGDSSQEGDTGE